MQRSKLKRKKEKKKEGTKINILKWIDQTRGKSSKGRKKKDSKLINDNCFVFLCFKFLVQHGIIRISSFWKVSYVLTYAHNYMKKKTRSNYGKGREKKENKGKKIVKLRR